MCARTPACQVAGALVAAALAISAGCGGPSFSRSRKDSLAGRPVKLVSIAGNSAVSDAAIEAGLAHREPTGTFGKSYTYYDPFKLRVDARRVEAYYAERGYYAAKVEGVSVRPTGRWVTIRFTVDEGPPALVQALDVSGAPADVAGAVDAIVAKSGLRVGTPLVHPAYLKLKSRIRRALVRAGYPHASVKGRIHVSPKDQAARIALAIDAGGRVRFGKTLIDGNERIPADVIRDRIAWEEGELFDERKLELTRKRLADLGLFSSIRVEYDKTSRAPTLPMEIRVKEAKRNELKVGGGFGFDKGRYEVRARAGYAVKSIFHPLVNFRFDSKVGYVLIPAEDEERGVIASGRASLERRDLFIPRLNLAATGVFERDVFEAYSTLGPSLRLAADRAFGEGDALRLTLSWEGRALTIEGADPLLDVVFGVESFGYRLGFYELSFLYDARSDPIYPKRGWLAELEAEYGSTLALGEFAYVRVTPGLRGYIDVGEKWVFAARVKVGIVESLDDAETPLTQRFFSGGSTSHRGFGFRQLSPTIFNVDGGRVPEGGGGMLETSFEARRKLFGSVRGVLFADGGDVTPVLGDIDVTNLHWAVGVGLRYDSVVGPGRVDVAYRVNRTEAFEPDGTPNPQSGSAFALSISLGEAF